MRVLSTLEQDAHTVIMHGTVLTTNRRFGDPASADEPLNGKFLPLLLPFRTSDWPATHYENVSAPDPGPRQAVRLHSRSYLWLVEIDISGTSKETAMI